jgi:tetratricopeptide (TPR) repeat protein
VASFYGWGHRLEEAGRGLEAVLDESEPRSPAWASGVAHISVTTSLLDQPVDRSMLDEAVRIDRITGCDKPGLALAAAARLAQLDDRYDEARRLYDEGEAVALSYGGYPTGRLQYADLDVLVDNLGAAEEILALYLDRTVGTDRVPALYSLALVHAWQGRYDAAYRKPDKTVNLQDGRTPRDAATHHFAAGFTRLLSGHAAEAWADMSRSAELFLARGIRRYATNSGLTRRNRNSLRNGTYRRRGAICTPTT